MPSTTPDRPIFVLAPPCAGGHLLALRLTPLAGERPVRWRPHHILEIAALAEEFPAAAFVYVHRSPAEVLPWMLAGWRSGTAVTHPELDWDGPPWSYLLVPNWAELSGRPLPAIVTGQWVQSMERLIAGVERLAPGRWGVISHDALRDPANPEFSRLARFLGLPVPLGSSANAPVDAPAPELLSEFAPYLRRAEATAARALGWFATP